MPIAYIINPQTEKIRQWVPKKAELVYVFEHDGMLGNIFSKKGIDTLSMRRDGLIKNTNLLQNIELIQNTKKVNYLVWRKFMVLYHFKTTTVNRKGRSKLNLRYLRDPMRHFVENNKNNSKAYKAIDLFELDIKQSVIELLYRESSEYNQMEKSINMLMDITKNLYYGYMDHYGYNRQIASLFQTHYYYIVINLLIKSDLGKKDFDSDGIPSKKLLTIVCRLFNESIVHRQKNTLHEKYNQITKTFKLIDTGNFNTSLY